MCPVKVRLLTDVMLSGLQKRDTTWEIMGGIFVLHVKGVLWHGSWAFLLIWGTKGVKWCAVSILLGRGTTLTMWGSLTGL